MLSLAARILAHRATSSSNVMVTFFIDTILVLHENRVNVPARFTDKLRIVEDYTIDSIWSPRIRIKQPARGYRFALDAILLAHFLSCGESDDVLEVGCGVGVVAVLLSHLQKFRKLTCVEIQPELAGLARFNLRENGVDAAEVLDADIREISGVQADLVYSNPPYRKAGAGRLNPQEQKAIARHEIRMTLQDLFVAAERLLKPGGRLTTILPDFREQDFRGLAESRGFRFRDLQYVHSFAPEPPAFFLSTLSREAGPLRERPRLIVYETPGVYTPEARALLTAPPA